MTFLATVAVVVVESLATAAVEQVEALATVAVVEAEALATVALTGGLELQISFFSTTVTISRDSSSVSRPLRCKIQCFVV